MTDYIVELEDGRIICFYEPDGKSQVVLVTDKASFLKRKYRTPTEIEMVKSEIEKWSKT